MLHVQVIRQGITQIYLLAAILSATGEKNPSLAWNLNMTGLLNVLDIAREENLSKVYWPSSIAVFGPTSPKVDCPQHTIIEPTTVVSVNMQVNSGVIIITIVTDWMFAVFVIQD